MSEMVGLIPAAGKGVRAYPYTRLVPKSLLEVDGTPLLQRNVELMRDQLGIRRVVIVVGHLGERIREFLGDGSRLGVQIEYVENPHLERELPYSIYLAAKRIDGFCTVVLADECYIGTNHHDLLGSPYRDAWVTCALIRADFPRSVRNNYAVELRDGWIGGLVEKPEVVTSLTMGTGTYVLHPDALARLVEDVEAGGERAPRDWTTWIDGLARAGQRVRSFELRGRYANVNARNELNLANYMAREHTFSQKTASLVYVVDDRAESAGATVLRYADHPDLDEIVTVVRSGSASLEAAAAHPKVKVIETGDPDMPVGTMLRTGLDAARGDILVTAYSDDAFTPRDVAKLLVYARDSDLVVGTRTTRQMIEQGSNMRGVVRLVHILLAKLIEVLWWRFDSRFTDICCAYRAVWRSTYLLIRDELRSPGVEIFPEMVIEVLRSQRRVVEIPVNYYNPDLDAPYVRTRYQTAGTLWRILVLILRRRVEELRTLRSRGELLHE